MAQTGNTRHEKGFKRGIERRRPQPARTAIECEVESESESESDASTVVTIPELRHWLDSGCMKLKLARIRGHLVLEADGVVTSPRKPDSFELEVGRFLGLP